MNIKTKFEPGDVVSHLTDAATVGVVTAFMVRGQNHSYEIQWGPEKSAWHMDFELVLTGKKHAIGYWKQSPE